MSRPVMLSLRLFILSFFESPRSSDYVIYSVVVYTYTMTTSTEIPYLEVHDCTLVEFLHTNTQFYDDE